VSNTETHDYIFHPITPCSETITYTITVANQCGYSLSWGSEVSCQFADPRIKYESDIIDGPCLRVCENSIINYELHGYLPAIENTDRNITGGTIVSHTNTNCVIQWSAAAFCSLQGIIHLANDTSLAINKCIEKLQAPHALFTVYPFAVEGALTTCAGVNTNFINHSFSNNGNDTLYYNWYFGDGTTSNEFEPVHIFQNTG
jgi:hypothetical protein